MMTRNVDDDDDDDDDEQEEKYHATLCHEYILSNFCSG